MSDCKTDALQFAGGIGVLALLLPLFDESRLDLASGLQQTCFEAGQLLAHRDKAGKRLVKRAGLGGWLNSGEGGGIGYGRIDDWVSIC